MDVTLHVWRQAHRDAPGKLVRYEVEGLSGHMSFLEMLDRLNRDLILRGEDPVAFDADCREGICGSCGMMVNGRAHGPERGTSVCQLHMRRFRDGDTIYVEPWRAAAFPVLRDLVVDRSAFERIIQAGGYISVNCGSAPDANTLPVAREDADRAFDAAACIGCGACVAACPNASAMLFAAAKISHLRALPQGAPEALRRTQSMVDAMDAAGFGNCTNHYECEAACPKEISVEFIAEMNRAYGKAALSYRSKK
jgi:succinate dehydrogenase / fumarate reductase, iron-sulfur subunit